MATQETLDRVQALYVAYYGRPADQEGQEYWADRIEAEGEGAIINAFGTSAEYTERFGDQSNADAINNLYNQMFGRDAEPNGLAYWSGVLNNGEKSLAEIATTILNAAGGQDRQVVNAKVEAAAEYTAEFGAAEDYNLEAATAVVAGTDGGVYVPELTTAIEGYVSAIDARAEFLVQADGDDDATTSATRGTLEADRDAAQGVVNGLPSENQLNANLQDAQDAVEAANENISEVAGLRKEISDYQAAQDATTAANAADVSANAELVGEVSAFESRNGGTLTVAADGTVTWDNDGDAGTAAIELIVENSENELEINQSAVDSSEAAGVEALLTDIQANLAAEKVVADAVQAEANALDEVEALEATQAGVTPGDTPLLDALVATQGQVESAETALEERAEAVADLNEAQELVDQLDALDKDIADAEKAISEQDVDLNDGDVNVETDLFVFDSEAGTTTDGSGTVALGGEDLFFIGTEFSRVDLEEVDDNLATTAFGESGALEAFFQQNGANVDVFFESEAFQGNATNGFEGATIQLTGVSIEDVQLENGYITIA